MHSSENKNEDQFEDFALYNNNEGREGRTSVPSVVRSQIKDLGEHVVTSSSLTHTYKSNNDSPDSLQRPVSENKNYYYDCDEEEHKGKSPMEKGLHLQIRKMQEEEIKTIEVEFENGQIEKKKVSLEEYNRMFEEGDTALLMDIAKDLGHNAKEKIRVSLVDSDRSRLTF